MELNKRILDQADEGNIRRRNKEYCTDLMFLTKKVIKHQDYLAKKKAKEEMLEALKAEMLQRLDKYK